MKILFVHNLYQQAGGEDAVVAAEIALLKRYHHQVELWALDNKNLPSGVVSKIKTAINTRYSVASLETARQIIRSFQPDIVHVHNFFPQISPAIYDACIAEAVPVVQSLHNYRLICPGAMLMRDGKICQQCISGSPYQAAWYACYRGSKLGSLAVAHMVAWHRQHSTWHDKVDRFITLTAFAKQKFLEAGFPAEKMAVKANFMVDPFPNAECSKSVNELPYALFVGRLSAEKGIKTLLVAWANLGDEYLLKVAGDGDLADLLHNQHHVQALGRLNASEVSSIMQQAAFLILPSEWFEGFPMVIVEAFAHGLPIIASRLGSMAEIIQEGENGLLFTPGDAEDLLEKIKYLFARPQLLQNMCENARRTYLDHYSDAINYQQLIAIYQDVINAKLSPTL